MANGYNQEEMTMMRPLPILLD